MKIKKNTSQQIKYSISFIFTKFIISFGYTPRKDHLKANKKFKHYIFHFYRKKYLKTFEILIIGFNFGFTKSEFQLKKFSKL